MKKLLRTQLALHSDQNRFRFSITCMECGSKWSVIPGNREEAPLNEDRAWDLAAEAAAQVFQICPICGHIVCKSCFVACGDLYMCRGCSRMLTKHKEA